MSATDSPVVRPTPNRSSCEIRRRKQASEISRVSNDVAPMMIKTDVGPSYVHGNATEELCIITVCVCVFVCVCVCVCWRRVISH